MTEFNMVLDFQFSGELIPKKKVFLDNPHENHNLIHFPNFYENLIPIYETYKASSACLNLFSEENRKTNVQDYYFEEDYNNSRKLSNITIEFLANHYTGKKGYDSNFDEYSKKRFWHIVDLNLPLTKIINIDCDIYWKRYYRKIIGNYKRNISLERLCDKNCNWKEIGISLKLSQYIENAKYEEWFEEKQEKLMDLLAPWIKTIKITTLKPMSLYSFKPDPNLLDYPIKNHNSEDWHHISLTIFSKLYNLTELDMEFSPPNLGINYERRLFMFSTQDVQNLALGLEPLQKLKLLHFGRCEWNLKKLTELIPKLKNVPIEDLQFRYCNLKDDCASVLTEMFKYSSFLKHLRLTGNKFTENGMSAIAYAIQEFKGELITLDISRNPIHNNGILFLGRALHNAPNQVKCLNLSSIEITNEGGKLISKILRFHHKLVYINMMALPIGEEMGHYLIRGLVENRNILEFDARYCELTHEQEVMVKILISRNNYINENPYIDRRGEDGIDSNFPIEWINRIKNPILLKVLNEIKKERMCEGLKTKIIQLPENIPKFIPKDVRIQRDCKEFVIQDLAVQKSKKSKRKKSIVFKFQSSTEGKETLVSESPKPEAFNKKEFYKFFGNGFTSNENVKYYF